MTDTVDSVYRDYVTQGVPSTGDHKPRKSEIRALLNGIVDDVADAVAAAAAAEASVVVEAERAATAEAALSAEIDAVEALAIAGVKPAKQSVRVLMITNVVLATAAENGDTLDGIVLATGNRVALTGQTAPAENGVYVVQASGAAVRATDMDSSDDLLGARFSVDAGTRAGETWGVTNTAAITVGSTAVTIVKQESANVAVAEVTAARSGEASLTARIETAPAKHGTNMVAFPRLDGGPYNLDFVNTSGTAQAAAVETSLASFLARGLPYQVQFPVASGGLFQYEPTAAEKPNLFDKYICGWFIGHTADVPPPGAVMRLVGASDGGSTSILILVAGGTTGRIEIDTDTWLFYVHGQMPSVGATYLDTADDLTAIRWGYTSNPSATTFSVSEHGIAVRDTPWVVGDIPVLSAVRRDKRTEEPKPTLTLNGIYPGKGQITAPKAGQIIKRTFWHKSPEGTFAEGYPAFNLSTDYVDDDVVHNPNDDCAPYFVDGGHRGASHLFIGSRLSATGHGKDQTDYGSIWTLGGEQYVLIRRISANQVLMAHRTDENHVPPTGTYVHVSGATHTGNIVATVQANLSWGPMITNKVLRTLVDGREIDSDYGVWEYQRNVAFIETYDVLAYTTVVDWFIANGPTGLSNVSGATLFTVSTVYDYDFEGGLTIYGDMTNVSAAAIQKLYGLQVQLDTQTSLYIPKSSALTIDGTPRNYSLIDDEITPASAVLFNTTNTTAGGLFLDRIITIGSDYALAVGFAPIQNCEPTVRRSTYIGSNTGLEISTAGKKYLRALDDSATPTAAAWDHYKWVGYRNVLILGDSGELPPYTVRTNEADFFIADWHDVNGVERLSLPADLVGRVYTEVEKLNVTLRSTSLNGSVLVDRATSGSYGFLHLKMAR